MTDTATATGTYSDGTAVRIEGYRGGFTYITFLNGPHEGVTTKVPDGWVIEDPAPAAEAQAPATMPIDFTRGPFVLREAPRGGLYACPVRTFDRVTDNGNLVVTIEHPVTAARCRAVVPPGAVEYDADLPDPATIHGVLERLAMGYPPEHV